ncbi:MULTISPECIES: TM2 domain-containing protein [Methylomicrobium]|uniref:Putative membrane protein n=1 Tax=Methylomicrobium album BG8 TaxID=686340 RepID=H8GKP5_METAL|nr:MULTISPECIES: TM2 domain-containing protein [Methylomicrobium]EIC28053.1 putative membrane protein [Methylomicrobium album BG8]
MIGKVQSFDPESGSGAIESEGQTYPFEIKDWVEGVPPEADDEVRFDPEGGHAVRVGLLGVSREEPKAVKSKYLAGLLSLLFGWAGLSRFYLGYYKVGFIQVLLTLFLVYAKFLVFVPQWGFLEAVLLLSSKFDRDAKGRPLK